MSKPLTYIAACLSQVTPGFFYTLHKLHLHTLCHPYSSQSLTKIALSPSSKCFVLEDKIL